MWFLTTGPLIWISVIFAEFFMWENCWCIFESLLSRKNPFLWHTPLLHHFLHFSIVCNNRRRTFRDPLMLQNLQRILFPSVLLRQTSVGENKKSLCLFLWALGYFWLLLSRRRGRIALVFQSLPVVYLQTSKRRDCAGEEVWLVFYSAMDLCFLWCWRSVAFENCTRRVGPKTFGLFRKIDEDSGGSMSWNTQPNFRPNVHPDCFL